MPFGLIRKLLVNPENKDYVVPVYVSEDDQHNTFKWKKYIFKFNHEKNNGQWILSSSLVNKEKNPSKDHYLHHKKEAFSKFSVVIYIAFHQRWNVRRMAGGFVVYKRYEPSLTKVTERTDLFWQFMRQFIVDQEYFTYKITGRKFEQYICCFEYQMQKFLENLAQNVVQLTPKTNHFFKDPNVPLLYPQEFQHFSRYSPGDFCAPFEPFPVQISLDSFETVHEPMSAMLWLKPREGGPELRDPYNNEVHDTLDISDTDKSDSSSPDTSGSLRSEFSDLSLEAYDVLISNNLDSV